MQIPLISVFDIDVLEPVTVETMLRLPNVCPEDVRAATHTFSSALERIGDCDAHREPKLLVELLMRYLLAAAHDLVEKPAGVLALFDTHRFHPWIERRCEVLVPSAGGAEENQGVLEEFLCSCSTRPYEREALRSSAVVIAVGSLATAGRLPVHEAPEPTQVYWR